MPNPYFIKQLWLKLYLFPSQGVSLQQYQLMDQTKKTALQILERHSKTFFIPIMRAPSPIKQALASSYLLLRAIDEVEDHPTLSVEDKLKILKNIALAFMSVSPSTEPRDLKVDWAGKQDQLLQVTLRIVEWYFFCPADFRIKMADFTITFAHRVAYWTECNWKITSESDMNSYIYAVAVLVGINWAEIFNFYDGTKIDYGLLEIFTRAHQGINILMDREKDLKRGVSFWPPGWTEVQMKEYVNRNLKEGDAYLYSMPEGCNCRKFFELPIKLAVATMRVREEGQQKLTRQQVIEICKVETQ